MATTLVALWLWWSLSLLLLHCGCCMGLEQAIVRRCLLHRSSQSPCEIPRQFYCGKFHEEFPATRTQLCVGHLIFDIPILVHVTSHGLEEGHLDILEAEPHHPPFSKTLASKSSPSKGSIACQWRNVSAATTASSDSRVQLKKRLGACIVQRVSPKPQAKATDGVSAIRQRA